MIEKLTTYARKHWIFTGVVVVFMMLAAWARDWWEVADIGLIYLVAMTSYWEGWADSRKGFLNEIQTRVKTAMFSVNEVRRKLGMDPK